MRAGRLDYYVTFWKSTTTTPDVTGLFEALNPPGGYASVQPLAPSADTRSVQSLVTIRYHPQINFDTRILYQGRSLFVRGVQDVDEQHVEMRLLCEEVYP
jgi:head-tail adaptor